MQGANERGASRICVGLQKVHYVPCPYLVCKVKALNIQMTVCVVISLLFCSGLRCCHYRSILQSAMRRLQVEARALSEDRDNLAEFVRTDAVTFDGKKQMAQ